MHDYRDNDFKHFGDVEEAACYIGDFCTKWGRMSVRQCKEKFGTARVYCSFGFWNIHSITHPQYVYNQYPQWLWKLDCNYGRFLVIPLSYVAIPWQKLIYKIAYKRAAIKYSHIIKEILVGADYPELLKGIRK